jgi:hypothetical protein
MKYKIVFAWGYIDKMKAVTEQLVVAVNCSIDDGWEPIGGPFTTRKSENEFTIGQAMTKFETLAEQEEGMIPA